LGVIDGQTAVVEILQITGQQAVLWVQGFLSKWLDGPSVRLDVATRRIGGFSKEVHMSRPNVRAIGAMLAAIFSFAVPAVAQKPGVNAAPSASTPMSFPAWAYPWVPDFTLPPDDGIPRRVPDSTAAFTIAQERDLFFSPDWHPEDHAPMPEVVARGRKPDVRACGSCHRAEGTGGPENANLAGLPAAYIVQQMADYKSGARKFSGPQRSPNVLMTAIAKAANDDEIQAAASYFSALKPKSNTKVVETDTVPKTYIVRVFVAKLATGGTESLGPRIVEVPVDVEQFEHRDSRSQFMVYAPIGSIAKGEALVKTGGAGQTVQCAICHGPDLKGVGPIPGIAGRSPSYVVRQLYDFKQGTRAGIGSALMKPTVEKLTEEDMVSLAAYLASLTP
jgi:cytochrome c553